ncbi:MAG TPA: glycosyltransferase [Candidatus Baltobacteraceae bacterium]|nr:glycosyltransferase [Candidatus Baltobacteraceae bacterium]
MTTGSYDLAAGSDARRADASAAERKGIVGFWKSRRLNGWIVFYLCIYLVLVIKLVTLKSLDDNLLFGIYSLAVSFYIISRFLLAHFYEPHDAHFDPDFRPTVTFAVPSKNEGENIRETILRIARSEYPKEKFDIIAIDDGSTDDTLSEMLEAKRIAAESYGVHVEVVEWKVNKGKREGMAACVRWSTKDLVAFIDSDSFVEPDTLKELTKYFADPKVAAVAGHAYVANADENLITKMQSARYFVAFKAYKAAESLFGAVTCCSGCCSAYRRSDVMEVLDAWLNQKFLGVTCTYGDDRSLTNFLLDRGKTALFSPTAISYTFVPDTFRKFMKQQLRWKKSWVRESIKAGFFIWRRHPVMSISFYLGIILPLLAPIIVFRALFWFPFATGIFPLFYLSGLLLMAFLYGLYYYIYTKDRNWIFGSLFAVFYTIVLIWQLPWAILNLRDSRWGTR